MSHLAGMRHHLSRFARWLWDRTGIPGYKDAYGKHQRGKTLWDVAGLIVIPVVLLAVGLWFTSNSGRVERRAAEQRAQVDRDIAADRGREEALQTYLSEMQGLMLDRDLRQSGQGAEVRLVARVRTSSILHRLDGQRNGTVVRFLSESGLITATAKGRAIADVRRVNLHGANLQDVDLRGIDLSRADLTESNLIDAQLDRAILNEADMTGASLTGARLEASRLGRANLSDVYAFYANMNGANLGGAILSNATLDDAHLQFSSLTFAVLHGAHLIFADLFFANLRGAYLQGADLGSAHLVGADLSDANLQGASLLHSVTSGVDLRGADLGDVRGLTQEQLDATRSYYGAKNLPRGLRPDTRPTPTREPTSAAQPTPPPPPAETP